MKIVFIASIRGRERYLATYNIIIDTLSREGNLVDHVVGIKESEIQDWAEEERLKYFNNFYKKLRQAELVVAECSYPSINVGYEVSQAIQQGKTIILLKNKFVGESLLSWGDPIFLYENLQIIEYEDSNLSDLLTSLLDKITINSQKQYNILLSPNLMARLEFVSKKKKVSKSAYIRELLEEALIKEDE